MRRLLTGLAEAFDVTLVAHDWTGGAPDPPPGVDYVPVTGEPGAKRLAQLASLPRPRSYGYGRYATPALRRAVLAVPAPQLVHFDDPGSALSGRVVGALNVVAPHDLESLITRRAGERGSWPRRTFAAIEARKQAREELSVCREMDLCVAVSEHDAAQLRRAGARRVIVCPNGTDPVPRLAPPRRKPDEPLRLLFVGNGDFAPNARGLEWLIDDVLPRVPASVLLDVVGQPPARPVRRQGVHYCGRVSTLRPYYERAHVAVAPIPFGSGTRLKIVEAMAHGRPVVSTTAGAEGLIVRPGQHYVAGDTPERFAAALKQVGAAMATDDGWLAEMLVSARRVAEGLFWPAIGRALAEAYHEALDASVVRDAA
jgi:polysaccharide biosynthesis protein PslH